MKQLPLSQPYCHDRKKQISGLLLRWPDFCRKWKDSKYGGTGNPFPVPAGCTPVIIGEIRQGKREMIEKSMEFFSIYINCQTRPGLEYPFNPSPPLTGSGHKLPGQYAKPDLFQNQPGWFLGNCRAPDGSVCRQGTSGSDFRGTGTDPPDCLFPLPYRHRDR